MVKVDLSNIPRRGSRYDWINSVGCIINAEFHGIKFEIKISNYERDNNISKKKLQYLV